MKKWINKQTVACFILGAIIFGAIPVMAESRTISGFYNNIRLKVNGIFIKTDVEPFIVNGRTMVPARFVAEPLGATVKFNETENCVEVVSKQVSTEGISSRYYKLSSYLYALKYAVSKESTVANNQFHMNLGILKFPGDTKYETVTLQANRREAKSEFVLKYFTEENYRYKDINTNCLPSEILRLKNIKEKVTEGFDYYVKAANERGFDNPKDYYSLDTDFWKLKGKGNIAMDDAQGLVEDFINYIDILVASGTAQ